MKIIYLGQELDSSKESLLLEMYWLGYINSYIESQGEFNLIKFHEGVKSNIESIKSYQRFIKRKQ